MTTTDTTAGPRELRTPIRVVPGPDGADCLLVPVHPIADCPGPRAAGGCPFHRPERGRRGPARLWRPA